MAKVQGKVKWFDPRKGYGFITTADGKDVFVHQSNVETGRVYMGFRPGDEITCELEDGERGTHATHVNIVNDKAEAAE